MSNLCDTMCKTRDILTEGGLWEVVRIYVHIELT